MRGEADHASYEENYTNNFPNMIYEINPFWENIRTCFNVKTLPDLLEKAGIAGSTTRTRTSG